MTTRRELVAGRLKLVLWRALDRVAHHIEVETATGWQVAWESVEGEPDDPWPASPALQQLHVETRSASQQVALLVGMAGRSHWSASFCVDAERGTIEADVACRLRDAPCELGSCYRGGAGHAAAAIGVNPDSASVLAADGGTVRIAPVSITPAPATIRWCYQFILA